MLWLIVAIALGIALAPYILSILGWVGGAILVIVAIGLALFAVAKGLDTIGDWFDRTPLGRWAEDRVKRRGW